MIPPALLMRLGIYAAALAAVLGALWYLHHKIDAAGYQRGVNEVSAAYAKRDREAQAAADRRLDELLAEKSRIETAARQSVAAIDSQRQREKNDATTKILDLNQRIANGFRLRDPHPSAGAARCGTAVPGAGADPGSVAGASAGEFSESVTQFLIAEAGRADEIARGRNECVTRMLVDRAR